MPAGRPSHFPDETLSFPLPDAQRAPPSPWSSFASFLFHDAPPVTSELEGAVDCRSTAMVFESSRVQAYGKPR